MSHNLIIPITITSEQAGMVIDLCRDKGRADAASFVYQCVKKWKSEPLDENGDRVYNPEGEIEVEVTVDFIKYTFRNLASDQQAIVAKLNPELEIRLNEQLSNPEIVSKIIQIEDNGFTEEDIPTVVKMLQDLDAELKALNKMFSDHRKSRAMSGYDYAMNIHIK